MFLFLHDLGVTNAFLLDKIRVILDLDRNYSDRFIMENFTIKIPGHCEIDKNFELFDIQQKILEFWEDKKLAQQNLAYQLMFQRQNSALISKLKTHKLNITGEGMGAVYALDFATKYAKIVDKMALVGAGNNFNPLCLALQSFRDKNLFKLTRAKLERKFTQEKDLRQKTKLALFLEHPKQQGYKSSFNILKNFNFQKIQKNLSSEEQKSLFKIPILLLNGSKDFWVSEKSVQKLATTLNQTINTTSQKTVIVAGGPGSTETIQNFGSCTFYIYKNQKHNIWADNFMPVTNTIKMHLINAAS